jgi:amylosucrase
MIGYVCYTDRFGGTFAGVREHVEYLAELGVTYLHLMPLLRPRDGENDGGYAVADYDATDPRLGTIDELQALADDLRAHGISLCIDLVMNHTAKEHSWALAAQAGDVDKQSWYLMFPDRTVPDAYELTLREVFPAFAPGNFTWNEACRAWVWTTFNEFQWDLDYSNPDVFTAMLDTMLRLSDRGVEMLRLDAVPFLWKRLGTDCENQPEVHALLCALRALVALAAPSMLFKAEAIVPPDQLRPYLGAGSPQRDECQLAYHNQLMVMLWSSLATADAKLLTAALGRMGSIPAHAGWVTYVRCHDDIGWAVTDEDAAAVGWDGAGHRRYLNDFYSGRFPGSFARGALFQENPLTGDARISGSAASLCGIEDALERSDTAALDAACARLELVYAVAFAFGGVPLLYMGDELGLRNDHGFLDVPAHAADNRWLHRPEMDWQAAARRDQPGTLEHRLFGAITALAAARRRLPALHGGAITTVLAPRDGRVFGFERRHPMREPLWMLANFGEVPVVVPWSEVPGLAGRRHDVAHASAGVDQRLDGVLLPPRGYAWLVPGAAFTDR